MMGSDPILDAFGDLPYPGKRKPANRGEPPPPPPPVVDAPWDAHPTLMGLGGQQREFFTIGALAMALGRKPVTIRAWENKGLLPKSPYRSRPSSRQTIPGEHKGKRLWLRGQVEGILRIAQDEGVILNNGPPPSPAFTQGVWELFNDIYQQLSSNNKENPT